MFLLISTLNGKTKELLPSAGILSHVNLLNTDHYMFHSINRDNEHNFESSPRMLLKLYFEVITEKVKKGCLYNAI